MITLWELAGRDGRRYSLFSWRTRMALRHKGLAFESRPVCMTDKAAIAFSGGKSVPIIKDGETVVRDSWKIAEHLESAYPERPLFGGPIGHGVSQAFNAWVDRALVPAMLPVVAPDVHQRVDPADAAYFRESIERLLKQTFEQARAQRAEALRRLARVLEPMNAALKRQPFVCGPAAGYADYILFSPLQWARVMSPHEVLAAGEPLAAWRDRMLDLFDGFAREAPSA